MTDRRPEIIGEPTFDTHHGISLMVTYRGLKGEPVDTVWITPEQAIALTERLARCVRQSMRHR